MHQLIKINLDGKKAKTMGIHVFDKNSFHHDIKQAKQVKIQEQLKVILY